MMRYANGFSSVCKEVSKDAISSAKAAERPPPRYVRAFGRSQRPKNCIPST